MSDSESVVDDPPHFIFIWTIGNLCEPCFVDSPTFTAKDIDMTCWYLTIEVESGYCIALHMKRLLTDNGPDTVDIRFDMSFLGADGLPIIESSDVHEFRKDGTFAFTEFADINEVFFGRRSEFMPRDSLTIRCQMWKLDTKVTHPDTCFARTLFRQGRYFFVWAIREFSTLGRQNTKEIFLNTTTFDKIRFQFFISEKDGEEYVGIRAEYSYPHEYHSCTVNISLLDFQGNTIHSVEGYGNVGDVIECEELIARRLLMEDRVSLLPNDVLSLRCEIKAEAEIVWSLLENYRYLHHTSCEMIESDAEVLYFEQDENVPFSFTRPMKELLNSGILSDVTLQTSTKPFPAHKCILSARSPVFKAMFTRDMNAKTINFVEILDVDEATLRKLLIYIYTNEFLTLNWKDTIDLLRAADKYKVLNLKSKCSSFLMSEICEDNVCDVLSVADMQRDRKLRDAAEEYLMHLGQEFFTSETWESFKQINTKLALNVLERMLSNMRIR